MRTEKLILKTFRNEKPSEKLFDVINIKLNGMKKDFVIEALVVPQICSPITNQMVTRVSQTYPHLQNLRLADSFDKQLMNRSSRPEPATLLKKRLWHRCFPVNFAKFLRTPFLQNTSGGCFCMNIDILIGTDFYHTFFTDETIRGKSNKP